MKTYEKMPHPADRALEKFPEKECQIKILRRRSDEGDERAFDILCDFAVGILPGSRYSGWGMY